MRPAASPPRARPLKQLSRQPVASSNAPLLACAHDARVLASPNQRHCLATQGLGVVEARPCVLPYDHQLTAAVQLDDEPRRRPRVEALPDDSPRMTNHLLADRAILRDRDALRANRHDPPL